MLLQAKACKKVLTNFIDDWIKLRFDENTRRKECKTLNAHTRALEIKKNLDCGMWNVEYDLGHQSKIVSAKNPMPDQPPLHCTDPKSLFAQTPILRNPPALAAHSITSTSKLRPDHQALSAHSDLVCTRQPYPHLPTLTAFQPSPHSSSTHPPSPACAHHPFPIKTFPAHASLPCSNIFLREQILCERLGPM